MSDMYLQKNEYGKIQDTFTKGMIVRSRAKWVEDGEKSTKYFLQLEKQNFKTKCIRSLKCDEKNVYSASDIMEECKKFYANLYTETKDASILSDCPFLRGDHPTLNEEEKLMCDKPVTMAECLESIKELPNNKSPGSDGLPMEFYKFFWLNIKQFVLESIQYSFDNNLLSVDQRRAILTLIPKSNKDIRLLKNWRPISLLNSEYKIIAKVYANHPKSYNESISRRHLKQ